MKKTIKIKLLLAALITLMACNKSKTNSNKLDGYKWGVKEITIEGVSETNLPEVLFKECDIYKESCEGSWLIAEGGRSSFIWQVRSKGKEFEISNQTDHAHSFLDVKAAEQCIKYSGVYNILLSKRKQLIIESMLTAGYFGKKVKIKFER
jgi:hypothetical protein